PAASPVAGGATPAAALAQGVQPDGSWVFTDDRGITVTLPQPPQRIFANLNAAAPLTDFGVELVGTYANVIPPDDPTWGNVDRDLPNLVADEMLDVEGLVALQPDLFVAVTWDPDEPYWVWGIEEGSYDLVNGIVPIICISTLGDPAESIGRFEALAGALGADLDTPELTAAREAYHGAIDDLATVAAAKPDLRVLYAYIPAEGDWLAAIPQDWPELEMYERLGVNIVSASKEGNQYWESISREDALRYPADVLMSSAFVESYRLEDLQQDPTFSRRPDVRAGQVGMWRSDFIMSYQGMTEPMQQFTALLERSEPVG
ncbi:MAG: ABC transporter substrate-binding protein, partial [Thermomicrobiales bacterium]